MNTPTFEITLTVSTRSGSVRHVKLTATVVSCDLNEHDLFGLMFAVEFAVNNHASEIGGENVRAHIFEKGEA